jgi:hypothetical protein
MLSRERLRQLLNAPALTDAEIDDVGALLWALAEIVCDAREASRILSAEQPNHEKEEEENQVRAD